MNTTPNEDRARHFMLYGGFSPATSVEQTEVASWADREMSYGEAIRDFYMEKILTASQPYLDDVTFAYNSPDDGDGWSVIKTEAYLDLDNLTTDTLRMLAAMAERVSAHTTRGWW